MSRRLGDADRSRMTRILSLSDSEWSVSKSSATMPSWRGGAGFLNIVRLSTVIQLTKSSQSGDCHARRMMYRRKWVVLKDKAVVMSCKSESRGAIAGVMVVVVTEWLD